VVVLDVRGQSEWDEGHMPGAKHMMLGYLPEQAVTLAPDKAVVVHCATGGRSAIAASLLQAHGIPTVINLVGGMKEWIAAGLPVARNGVH
jgi:hydroxyacylglutathione hydrolase